METKYVEILTKILKVVDEMPQSSHKEKLLKLLDEIINSL